ncbi:hypothetical protein MES4922_30377 [Mesorhizobium ventifaucium]|uniref:Uncharacterized protein n=1 Tax=Mesorhizobium ventifaucium TaxID=666020 RepID=A0ABM9DZ00_9HYPH|nr:hypothetical protein MES4922_30377 [Mesorhizobium ventifaucium]
MIGSSNVCGSRTHLQLRSFTGSEQEVDGDFPSSVRGPRDSSSPRTILSCVNFLPAAFRRAELNRCGKSALNRRGIASARGGTWTAVQVTLRRERILFVSRQCGRVPEHLSEPLRQCYGVPA